MKSKNCTQCKKEKLTKYFYAQRQIGKHGQIWHYFDSMCKTCRKQYSLKRRDAIKIKAIIYKGSKCIDCSLTLEASHPCVFDFHHIDPTKKSFSISKRTNIKFEKLQNELDKTILLCSNCHRIREYK